MKSVIAQTQKNMAKYLAQKSDLVKDIVKKGKETSRIYSDVAKDLREKNTNTRATVANLRSKIMEQRYDMKEQTAKITKNCHTHCTKRKSLFLLSWRKCSCLL